ncbi:MAG TPA: HlyD family efflux transporter periplasmic adaptor subunit [Planctomycetota bacterium]|nr:HlyD family efflux transporter periplasmic adaptor subunit [Planctomycetota bacterium]
MKKLLRPLIVVAILVVILGWWLTHRARPDGELTLYGTVDLRQVELAFNNNERIDAILVEEGSRVEKGQVLARVETFRLAPMAAQARAQAAAAIQAAERLRRGLRPEEIAQAEAQYAAQKQIVEKLRHGSRPEEIAQAEAQYAAQKQIADKFHHGSRPEEVAQAKAGMQAAQAAALLARQTFDRVDSLYRSTDGKAVSKQELDAARAGLDGAEAQMTNASKTLELVQAGPRAEDVAAADAQLTASEQAVKLAKAGPRAEDIAEAEARRDAALAQAALLDRQLADAALAAPTAGVVRSRILEPGEMASPQKPVLSLAVTDPKWVRAYVAESEVGILKEGLAATVTVDSFPNQPFTGWVGFISPVAEFTPKAVQTEELRTSLVYEVRIYVNDVKDQLRLGMPATVQLNDHQMAPAHTASAAAPAPAALAPAATPAPAPLPAPVRQP